MENVFRQVLNMSITGSYVILAILVIRLLLRKAPKKYSYALWSVAAFRLACPVSFQSAFSLLSLLDLSRAETAPATGAIQYVPENIGMMAQPQVTVGIPAVNSVISQSLPAPVTETVTSVNPMQVWMFVAAVLWCIGIAVLVGYSVVSYAMLCRKMRSAVLLEDNIRQSDRVRSPFILGFVKPKIYIPFGLSEETLSYVLAHERYHIKRLDHLVKPLAFLLLAVHWFNPLCWLAFHLMGKDMEMSCDEKVLSGQENIRKAYSTTLLSFAAGRRFPAPSPLAFGESSVKSRIKNALHWKKPALWVTIAAVVVCVAAVVFCAADPADSEGTGGKVPFAHTYRVDAVVYADGRYSYVPTPSNEEVYVLTSDMLLQVKSEDGWRTLGKMEEFELTRANFDDLLDTGSTGMWGPPDVLDGMSRAASQRKDTERAWRLDTKDPDLNDFYYILQEKDGEVRLVYGYHEHGNAKEDMIRWILTLSRVDRLDVTVSGDNGRTETTVEPVWYGESEFDFDYETLAFAAVVGDGFITFDADWGCDTLTVSEHYYSGYAASGNGVEIEKDTHKIQRNEDGDFVLDIARRNHGGNEYAIYYVAHEEMDGKYIFRVDFPMEVEASTGLLPNGSYSCTSLIYLNPASSALGVNDNGLRYVIEEDGCVVIDKAGGEIRRSVSLVAQQWRTISETEWNAMFLAGIGAPSIKNENALIWEVMEDFSLMLLQQSGRLWMVEHSGRDGMVWEVYELAAEAPSDAALLTADEIRQVNERFAPIIYDKQGGVIGTNSVSCFFTSYYSDIKDLALDEFMAYFPNGAGTGVSDAEFAALKASPDWPFGADRSRENMPVPIHKYERRQVDLILNEYAGITTADLSGVRSDNHALMYLEEYDAYYNFTSDFGPGVFHCVGGAIQDDLVYLYSYSSVLTLHREGDRYLFQSFLPLAEQSGESSLSAYDTNNDGILQLTEFPIPDGEAMGLRHEEANLYSAVAKNRFERLYSVSDGEETMLMLPALTVWGQYDGENGETHYVCGMNEMYYYDLGEGLADPESPAYSSIGGGGTMVRITLAADETTITDWQETYDGADNTERIRELCGPLTELANGLIGGADIGGTQLAPAGAQERLDMYLDCYFI